MRLATVIAVVICLIPGLAAAQQRAGSVFEVPEVPVSAEAESATAAQQIARDLGRRRAMDLLLRRLTAEDDWIYLPQLAAGDMAPAAQSTGTGILDPNDPAPAEPARDSVADYAYGSNYSGKQPVMLDPSQLPAIEEGFATFDEKSSSTSYSANITYRFKADDVRAMLKDARIPYSESQTRMALVIPVLETANDTYLWESNNPWARAWLARALTNELTPMLLPRGDDTDMALLPVDKAVSRDQAALQEIAERYGVTQVLIAHAILAEEDGRFRMRARLLDGYLAQSGRSAANYTPTNSAALYDSSGGYDENGAVGTAGEAPGRVLMETFYREEAGDFPAMSSRAVENTVAKYASDWKAQTLVDHSVVRQVRVNAWFDSLDDFSRIRTALEASPIVESIEVEAMAAEGGTLTIMVAGDIQQLVADLRQRNVVFWTADNIVWNIATPAKALSVQARILPLSDDQIADPYAEQGMPDGLADQPDGGLGDFSPPLERERRQLREDGPGSELFGNDKVKQGTEEQGSDVD